MEVIHYFKSELKRYNKFEKIFYPLIILSMCIISVLFNDNKIALISAVCGVSYTLFAGKGKVYCYYIGAMGTFCYCYIAYKNGFWGNLGLYGLYFLPMQMLGIFKWKKHLDKKKNEIIKTKLKNKERIFCLFICLSLAMVLYFILQNEKNPILDSLCVSFSILGQYLTLKRCIEQWYVWFFVNIISSVMWILACIRGADCFVSVFMWLVYTFLALYFLLQWKKDMKDKSQVVYF